MQSHAHTDQTKMEAPHKGRHTHTQWGRRMSHGSGTLARRAAPNGQWSARNRHCAPTTTTTQQLHSSSSLVAHLTHPLFSCCSLSASVRLDCAVLCRRRGRSALCCRRSSSRRCQCGCGMRCCRCCRSVLHQPLVADRQSQQRCELQQQRRTDRVTGPAVLSHQRL